MKHYAGIGSRETPPEICTLMRYAAEAFAFNGWTLRSGHAPGADQAFERGAAGRAQIFLPNPSFYRDVTVQGEVFPWATHEALQVALDRRPDLVNRSYRMLFARNVHQILGPALDDPVSFVVAWTKEPFPQGGTAFGVKLAESLEIPVFNLALPEVQTKLRAMIDKYVNDPRSEGTLDGHPVRA